MSSTRKERRWELERAVSFCSERVRGSGTLRNISRNGLFVRTPEPPEVGAVLELTVQGTSPPAVVTGEVRWAERSESGGSFGVLLQQRSNEFLALVASVASERPPIGGGPTRSAPRVELRTPVAIEVGDQYDGALLSDISFSGARLENAHVAPPIGSEVTLAFAMEGHSGTFEVRARVVRRTETGGYAVRFEAIGRDLKALLERILATLRSLPETE